MEILIKFVVEHRRKAQPLVGILRESRWKRGETKNKTRKDTKKKAFSTLCPLFPVARASTTRCIDVQTAQRANLGEKIRESRGREAVELKAGKENRGRQRRRKRRSTWLDG